MQLRLHVYFYGNDNLMFLFLLFPLQIPSQDKSVSCLWGNNEKLCFLCSGIIRDGEDKTHFNEIA